MHCCCGGTTEHASGEHHLVRTEAVAGVGGLQGRGWTSGGRTEWLRTQRKEATVDQGRGRRAVNPRLPRRGHNLPRGRRMVSFNSRLPHQGVVIRTGCTREKLLDEGTTQIRRADS